MVVSYRIQVEVAMGFIPVILYYGLAVIVCKKLFQKSWRGRGLDNIILMKVKETSPYERDREKNV